ncbi:hypothetical protein BDV28DRAFT_94446 [Aspergillus coremiiformis]|uniref:Uncharacterized protein n=1 Tax=Aspergillus coremiiformis TaxID=138285 RepID=A0A5N6ZFZ1_9EURO|nr:hypothetical protein BDV28DRAFT_94446 [Aspergillus coremiiformis]
MEVQFIGQVLISLRLVLFIVPGFNASPSDPAVTRDVGGIEGSMSSLYQKLSTKKKKKKIRNPIISSREIRGFGELLRVAEFQRDALWSDGEPTCSRPFWLMQCTRHPRFCSVQLSNYDHDCGSVGIGVGFFLSRMKIGSSVHIIDAG